MIVIEQVLSPPAFFNLAKISPCHNEIVRKVMCYGYDMKVFVVRDE